ncbi:helix-turn-helix domain-containing protein [Bradyrhizobium liaoningense]|nr:helix-turn-helix domain-containing protein [Bradyrhizobium liaoningense]
MVPKPGSISNHRFTAEAVVQTTVYLMKRVSLQSMADTDAAISRNLLTMTTANLEHAENHMLLLGRKTAVERVAAFLIEMDRRTGSSNVSLPMSRRDIADYLGLSLETVSRAVSRLHCEGVLNFIGNTQREIVILDLSKLHSFDPQG